MLETHLSPIKSLNKNQTSVDESSNVVDNVHLSWKFQICTSPIIWLSNLLGHQFWFIANNNQPEHNHMYP